ncbi:MAG: CoA transferase [Pseudonocardia sp.]
MRTDEIDVGSAVPAALGPEPALAGLTFALAGGGRSGGLLRAEHLLASHLGRWGAEPSGVSTGHPDQVEVHVQGAGLKVECRLSGWGGLVPGPFTETLAQARCGLMAVHGRATGGPRRLGVDLATAAGATVAMQGILAALLGQLRGVEVRTVDLDVARVALLTVGQYLAAATATEDPEVVDPHPDDQYSRPPFVSADGVVFELETLYPEPWEGFWSELGAEDRVVAMSWRPFLLRYARAVCPLAPGLHTTVGRWGFDDLRQIARRTGMSICRIRPLAERRIDPDIGDAPWSVQPLSDAAGPPRAPIGFGGSGPLSGLQVVESCRRVQGPLAGRLLGMLGATVVRIEPPGGDPLRGMPPMAGECSARFVALNRDKDVVEIDIKSAAGRTEVLDLVAGSDVFLHNWAPGKAAALGLDSADMARVSPGIVYAYPSGWGDALGPNPPLGTDFMVQAFSGVADVATVTGRAQPSLMTLLDLFGGLLATEAILGALVTRHRTGRGQLVGTSLLSASRELLADELTAVGRPPRGCGAAPDPVDAVFATSDLPLAVSACSATAVQRLAEVCEVAPTDGSRGRGLPERIAERLTERPAEAWAVALTAAGVPCAVVRTDLADVAGPGAGIDALPDVVDRTPGCAVVTAPWRFR